MTPGLSLFVGSLRALSLDPTVDCADTLVRPLIELPLDLEEPDDPNNRSAIATGVVVEALIELRVSPILRRPVDP